MNDHKIKLFESQQIRNVWDTEAEKWWFSVIDVVAALTEQTDDTRARKYWSVLKVRLKNEGSQLVWLAEVGRQRLDQLQDPELSIEQAMRDYKRLGYTDNWINQRLKRIEIRKELNDEWKKHGVQEGPQLA